MTFPPAAQRHDRAGADASAHVREDRSADSRNTVVGQFRRDHAEGRTSERSGDRSGAGQVSRAAGTVLVYMGGAAILIGMIGLLLAISANAADKKRPPNYDPAYDRSIVPQRQAPPLRVPSPDNSQAGSPIRDYIYRPPADSGSVTNRLNPPTTIRPGPRGY
ncbi:MAG: hypothetical protein KDJ37_06200 [Hyphomicrobiaceae bacterium]|nr:hypothetical protein [Hyphomicrobiaceae bacterium]